jgi:Fe-S-cluster containining protein
MPLVPGDVRSERLIGIFTIIESRVERILKKRPDWPCHKGCDQCCRQLAQPPVLTAAEWHLLCDALAQLNPVLQQQVGERITALAHKPSGPLTCPLLDDASGTCLVYEARPAICRMYGFYASGMHNLWCDMLQAKYESGAYDEVVLGNHHPVDRALQQDGGETRSLVAWYQAMTQNLPPAVTSHPDKIPP